MDPLTLGSSLAEPMHTDPTSAYPWTEEMSQLKIAGPGRVVVATVAHYPYLSSERPWKAWVSVTEWHRSDSSRPVRSSSWHETAAEAKAAVERLIGERA